MNLLKIRSVTMQFGFDVFDQVDTVENEVWAIVNPEHSLFFSKEYFYALERSMPEDMSSRYIVLYNDSKPVALFYFQIINLSLQKSNSILNLDSKSKLFTVLSKPLSYLFESSGSEQDRCIIIGGNALMSGQFMFSTSNAISYSTVFKEIPGVVELIKTEISSQNKKVEGALVKDFYPESIRGLNVLNDENYHSMRVDPNMILKISNEWKNLDHYMDALSSKYRVRVKKILKTGEVFDIRRLTTEDIVKYTKQIEKLYLSVHNKSNVRLTTLNINYFIGLNEHLPDNFVFKAYFLDGEIVGFMTELFDQQHFEAHYIGLSYEHIKSHSLYQHMLVEFIRDAIDRNVKRLCYGRTAMEIKSNLGAEPHELVSYIKLNNSFTNRIIGPFVPQKPLKNWVQRKPFKASS